MSEYQGLDAAPDPDPHIDYDAHVLEQQILEAYGFDELTPDERALWDAWVRAWDAVRAADKVAEAMVVAFAETAAARVAELIRAVGELPEGVRFEWGKQ